MVSLRVGEKSIGEGKECVKKMLYHIYCDESRQTQDRYMVLGGIIVPSENVILFDGAMKLYRETNNMKAELKWSKVSNQKLSEYKALIDLFFTYIKGMHFKSIVIDTHQIDHKKYSKGNKELGFYKFMYQFLLHSFGHYAKNDDKYIIYLDERNSSYSLGTLKLILNRGLKKKFKGKITRDIIRNIEPKNSKDIDLLQVADILMGAIGYEMNLCHLRSNAKRGKILLCEYIANKMGMGSLMQETPYSKKDFSIWHFSLRK